MLIKTYSKNQPIIIQDKNLLSGQTSINTIKITPNLINFENNTSLDEVMYLHKYICTYSGTSVPARVQTVPMKVRHVLFNQF